MRITKVVYLKSVQISEEMLFQDCNISAIKINIFILQYF